MSKADALAAALDEFLAVSPDVEAAAVVTADGLPMASALPPDVEEDRLAAMSAALITLGERAADNLGKGGLAQVFVEGEDGYVVLMAAGYDAVLVCVTTKDSKVGLVLFELRRAAEKVADIMEGRPVPSLEPEDSEDEAEFSDERPGSREDRDEPLDGFRAAEPPSPSRTFEPPPGSETETSVPTWQ
jgi:predicted regulator of Ras-like GTPase activity (Roadblock/LC7/MglB family)